MAVAFSVGDAQLMTRFRRTLVWVVVSLVVFMLLATLILDGTA